MKNSLIARIAGVPLIDGFNDLNFYLYLPELDDRIFLNEVHNVEHNHKCCRISKALFKLVNSVLDECQHDRHYWLTFFSKHFLRKKKG